MHQAHFTTTPPREAPKVLLKSKAVYQLWLAAYRDLPRVERFGLGRRVEQSFLDVLELIFSSIYLAPEPKLIILSKAITKLDLVKFFLQLTWESKLITTAKYAELSPELEEIGRQLGAWKKGLENKTPQP